jgi:hypothetical protein
MIEWFKMSDKQWIIKRQDKTYPIKNLESLFVNSLIFGIKLQVIEESVLKMNREDLNYARFFRGQVELGKK